MAEADRAGIAALHERYLQAVFAYVSTRVPNRAEAEDITADIFAAAVVELSRFRGESGHYAWLLGIARRKIVDAARRRRRRPELLEAELSDDDRQTVELLLAADAGPLPEEVVQNAEAQRVMRGLIDRLPEQQREALLLQVVDDLPIREIAHVLGRSLAATNSLLQRARAGIFRHGKSYFTG